MRGKCLDEGMLQAYLDGELSQELAVEAATHLGGCDACAEALGAAEAEGAFFAQAFAPNASVSVPTVRLRERLDSAIAGMETRAAAPRRADSSRRAWGLAALAAWASQTFGFEPRLAGAFAGLAALVLLAGVFGVVYFRGDDGRPTTVAENTPAARENPPAVATKGPDEATPGPAHAVEPVRDVNVAASQPPRQPKRAQNVRRAGEAPEPKASRDDLAPVSEVAAQRSVPGEENYLRTIASLEKVVEVNGADGLRPQLRSEYERNIAVLDRAITDTRQAALRNPKDTDTAAFLFSAYQNKIELMTTIADQAQVATLGN